MFEAFGEPAFAERVLSDGYAIVPGVLDSAQCRATRDAYTDDDLYRSRVVMEQHHFGRGEYRYFRYPLPPLVETLRTAAYAALAPLANRWMERCNAAERFPATLAEMLERCGAHAQARPTALVLKYGPGDYNALHQDLYGEIAFPLQLTVFLSEPQGDYTGGEFILAESRPRRQTTVEAIVPQRGDAVVFPNQYRPVPSARGYARAGVRHGVSRVRSGERYTLGVIFHDAR